MNIPNHDRKAVSQALEAAMYCAAFQRLEEMEMKQIMRDIRKDEARAPVALRRRLARRRGLWALGRALPRAVRAAAALVAVLSIGAGIALAASPAARQWAAGVLQSRVVDPEGFFGEERSTLTDGAVLDGRLLVVEDNESISAYDGTDAKPTTYAWRDAGSRAIEGIASEGGALYAIYAIHDRPYEPSFDGDWSPVGYGIGQVALSDDGTLDVTELAAQPATALLDPEGRPLGSWRVKGLTAGNGALYFIVDYDLKGSGDSFSFAPGHLRLFAWRLSDGALAEIDLAGVAMDWEPELFGGDGQVYLAVHDDGAAETRIYRINGETMADICQLSYSGTWRAGSFALRSGDDALVYMLDGSVYVAPGFDPSKAVRAALCGTIDGCGLMLDDATYAVVQMNSVDVFDLSVPLGEVDELVVDGDMGNGAVSEAFMAEHPNTAVVTDAARTPDAELEYSEMLLTGTASGDVVTLDEEGFEKVRDAGLVAPLTDPALVTEWEKLPEGVRASLSVDGRPVAVPMSFYAYSDVMFPTETWQAVRGDFEDYPDTWLDYANWLAAFSRSRAAEDYLIEFDGLHDVDMDIPDQFRLLNTWRMIDTFARCWKAMGEEIDFGKPEFTACLDALADVDWSALRYEWNDGPEEKRAVICDDLSYEPGLTTGDWFACCRTLRIRDDAPRISRASGAFSFIPAASTRKATAQAYLKCLVEYSGAANGNSNSERYDFATDPGALAAQSGGSCSAEDLIRYREQVGDAAFPPRMDRETSLAVQDAVAAWLSGGMPQEAMIEAMNGAYNRNER